ncbi:hypothetical protein [Undibacterium pigrum]|uniref:SH3 domain-containing protein n=1 Tax=Undibacterium pigrum TaxID=401470 RepID=A0A318J4G9_9BURK|nr:hypothetical protein [Undibacterium pigrum]PXX41530.1 hypothetical protein DFR42_107181 [Undibacterium pigrum]
MKNIQCAYLFLHVLFLPAALIAKESFAALAVVQTETYVQEAPAGMASGSVQLVAAGEIVNIKKRQADWIWIVRKNGHPGGWISAGKVISQHQFSPVYKWKDPSRIKVGGGDYEAHYKLRRDGSFAVEETAMRGEDGYHLVKRYGRLQRHGKLVWARVGNETLIANRIFLLHVEDGSCQLVDNIAACDTH